MSILACSGCGWFIDTDDDTEAWIRQDITEDGHKRDVWLCERCREDLEELEDETQ